MTGPAPIYLRITVEGKRAELATGRECDPERWNGKLERVTGTKEDIRNFHAFLSNYESKVYQIHRLLCEKGESLTAESLKISCLVKMKTVTCFLKRYIIKQNKINQN